MSASLPALEQKALSHFKRRLHLRHESAIVGVYLYGSKARGDARATSDIDVLVVVQQGTKRQVQETAAEIVSSLVCAGAPYLSVMVQDTDHWSWETPFTINVRRDAIAL